MADRTTRATRARWCVVLGVVACLGLAPATSRAGGPSDLEILQRADRARGNLSGISWDVKIVSNDHGFREQDFYVRAREFDVLAQTTFPPRYKGSKILMVNKNMMFSSPNISKPVPISQRQKLQGLAAYGDIPATNYASDYRSRRLPPEHVDGELCWVFDLTAKDKKRSTYDRVRYWVSQSRFVGIMAEFYTVSGMCLKKARMTFDNTVDVDGQPQAFISQIDFKDKLRPKLMTTMSFSSPSIKPIPAYVFNPNLMSR
ncbi:MAG: outer membrane lipoprotein-sorting protein [Candidatus Riflebacteria bacterium]|nr:outer membrane lipoprotein-sorting protein [Candidatus Riflebacteria bacterium]